jgi:D-aspartate ligase
MQLSHPTVFIMNHIGDPLAKGKQMNLSTLAVARSLGRRKVSVVLITPAQRDAVIQSRYVKAVEYCPYMHESETAVLAFFKDIDAKYPGKKVLLPCVDEAAWFVGKYYDQLSQYFLIPAPDAGAMDKINNKKYQYEIAQSVGIPIPETYFPSSLADIESLAEKVQHYPYVIKPNVSFEWKMQAASQGARGKKGLKVNSSDQLLAVAEEILTSGQEFMVQEVIGGRDHRLITFLGFFDKDSKPYSWFIRKKIRQCPIDFGYCTMTESCHNEKVFEQSVKLLQTIGYHGVAGVEWKLDPETDTYKLIEINGRPVNTTGCAVASGVDLPSIAYFFAIGQPLPAVTDWKDGQRWAWAAMDFWAAKELASLGQGSMWKWFKEITSIKADAVFAWDDLLISLRYYSTIVRNIIFGKITSFFRR